MLAGQLSDAGLRVDFPPPSEQRGVGHEIVHVLMRIESDVEAGVVGGVGLATVQRIIRAFTERHPAVHADAEQTDDE
jgi:hypothetical protein